MAKHVQITQNNKFVIFSNILKKEESEEDYFFHADKLEDFLQINTRFLMGRSIKVPKIASLQYLYNIWKKELEFKLIFYMQINIKVSYKLISALWTSKLPTRWYYHYWWVWSSILKMLKVTSLQYLYNISKKKLGMEFIFCMQINIKVSTTWHYYFWWKSPDMSKVLKIQNW